MLIRNLLVTVVGALCVATGAEATTIFDLGGSVGATPTFSIASNGVTATYTSPAGNGFAVQDTTGLLSFTPGLVDNNFFSSDDLTITFSQAIGNTVFIPFAILDAFDFGTDFLTVTANTGQTASFGTTPDGLTLNEPEGIAAFTPTGAVTSLTLSSPIAFAVGNVAIPEPTSIALFGIGVIGLVASRRRSIAPSSARSPSTC